MADVYEKEFGRRSEVIAYGAELPEEAQIEERNPLGLESGSYYLNVGRLIPDNNSELLLDGFLQVQRYLVQVSTRNRLHGKKCDVIPVGRNCPGV